MTFSCSGKLSVAARLGGLACMLTLVCAAISMPIGQNSAARASEASAPPYIGYTKINVSNLERSLDFYTNVMGLKVARVVDRPALNETLLTRSGGDFEDTIVLVFDKKRTEPLVIGNGFNNITFIIFDFEERVAKVEAAGYVITGKRTNLPSPKPSAKTISVAFTKDPDGYAIELLQFHQ